MEKKVTPEEFAKKYRELFDMAAHIEGINSTTITIHVRGDRKTCDKVKYLVDLETAQASLMQLEEGD